MQIFKDKYSSKIKGDPATNPRALAKLLKESQRVKTILSANSETFAQVAFSRHGEFDVWKIEGLFEEVDFKAEINRDDVEQLGEDLYPRVAEPISKALAAANMTVENISFFIVVGGAVR